MSALPTAGIALSGLKATANIFLLGHVSGAPNGVGRSGVKSHNPTVPSALPAASVRPSGLNATACT